MTAAVALPVPQDGPVQRFWAGAWAWLVVIVALVVLSFVIAGTTIGIWYLLLQWAWAIFTVGGAP